MSRPMWMGVIESLELWRQELRTNMPLLGLISHLELLLPGHSSHLLPAELLHYHEVAGLPADSLHVRNGSPAAAYRGMACGSALPTIA